MRLLMGTNVTVAWTPAAISTALWLDAADTSTITTVLGGVSEWRDKSGNGRSASQSTAGNRPAYKSAGLNGLNTVTFDGLSKWLTLASSILSSKTSFSWYLVSARNDANLNCFFMERTANSDAMVALIATTTTSILNRAGGTSASSVIEQTEYQSLQPNSAQIFASVQAATSGTAYRNGFSVATNAATKASLSFRRLVIGGAYGGDSGTSPIQQFLNGYIAEMIFTLNASSNENRQRLEGYLAHKWGLLANLPANHPYKLSPPIL